MKTMTQCSRRFAPRTSETRRGFTLLELLVAAMITALLAGFLAVVVGDVAGFWSRTSGRLTTEAQARIVLDQLTLDLQSARFEDDGNTWLAATVQISPGGIPNWISNDQNPARAKPATALSLSMTAADFSSDANRFGVAGTWLRFYTTARGTNQNTGAAPFAVNASAPVAVSYQIVRRIASTATTTAAARRYLLHRAQVRPALNGTALGTLEAGQTITAPAYTRTTPAAGNTGVNGDPRTVRAPTLDSVIADNVIDFGVRLYVRDAATTGGLRLVFPATSAGVPANTPLAYVANVPPGGNGSDSFANRMPDVVDVSVRILTEKGADLIRGYESITQTVFAPPGVTPQAYWWEIARANSRVFTRRIVLRAEPL